jgi:hypothetical protein
VKLLKLFKNGSELCVNYAPVVTVRYTA